MLRKTAEALRFLNLSRRPLRRLLKNRAAGDIMKTGFSRPVSADFAFVSAGRPREVLNAIFLSPCR